MEGIKDALLRMVRAGMKAKKLDEQYLKTGIDDTPPFEIFGDILDGIYCLLGEHTETIEESTTYIAMTAPILSEERRTEMLYAKYLKNHPEFTLPKPFTIERDELRKMQKANGGYMTPEGDWS